MNYRRVCPRDLFNESKLLKCLGQLSLIILDGCSPNGTECPKSLRCRTSGKPFQIVQREEDGGLMVVSGVRFYAKRHQLVLYSAYNSKSNYPLYCDGPDGDTVTVLNGNGSLTQEFVELVNSLEEQR